MPGTRPAREQNRERDAERLRITLKDAPDRWTFTFTRADAPAILNRIDQLERDSEAPLDRAAASVLRDQVRDLVAEAGAGESQVGDSTGTSAPAPPSIDGAFTNQAFTINHGKSRRQRCTDE